MTGGPLVSSLFLKTGGPLVLFLMKVIGCLVHHVTVIRNRMGHWFHVNVLFWSFNALKDNFGVWWRHRGSGLPGNHHHPYGPYIQNTMENRVLSLFFRKYHELVIHRDELQFVVKLKQPSFEKRHYKVYLALIEYYLALTIVYTRGHKEQ